MRQRVDKLVAKQAYEAVHEVLNHFQALSMSIENKGLDRPNNLIRDYGRVRRLRDYLRNVVRSGTQPTIELDEDDSNLLVSCCVFTAENLETGLTFGRIDGDHVKWAEGNLRNLHFLASEFASRSVNIIEGPGRDSIKAPGVRKVVAAINTVVRGEQTKPAPGLPAEIVKGEAFVQNQWIGGHVGQRNPMPDEGELATIRNARADVTVSASVVGATLDYIADEQESNPSGALPGGAIKVQLTLDTTMIQDPRLRSMLLMDLRALNLAVHFTDYRFAAAVLAAVFEAIVVDIALQNRDGLGLSGEPYHWDIKTVVPPILGGQMSSGDRKIMFYLIACQGLMRPAIQLAKPLVVTKQTLDKLLEFVRRFLHATGYLGSN